MEILGIGPLEAIFIVVLALIAIGPRDLGTSARSLGRTLNRVYRSEAWHSLTQASRNLRGLPNRLAREAALEELDQVRRELKDGSPPPTQPDQLRQPAGSGPGPVGPGSPARPQPEVVRSADSELTGPEPDATRVAERPRPKKPRATKLPSGVVIPRKATRSPKGSSRAGPRGKKSPPSRRPAAAGPRKSARRTPARSPRPSARRRRPS
jgi:Sec-independent protein translocase protein TatA